ncbi:glycosyltransferase [Deminuibacter soli]|uniref:Glycosyltransferase n=1 Tax=Deminuibacter soli TaxID=2291815 RepID=A0A3E1NGD5_9BACT|nr:glycosyltransferase [Deminuibacter soli]RFM26947.1 glycosyltransferase [Deminuibacter soli]
MTTDNALPLVSCIMPTFNRRPFIPHAIRYFLRQEYPRKELIIVDDGTDAIEDLVPGDSNIRYIRLQNKITLGAKLNLACTYAAGNILANWDDDDWYAPRRLQYQVNALQNHHTDICGINNLLYFDLRNQNAYNYVYPSNQRKWMLGSSLCYTREFWSHNQFADIDVGMDGLFVWRAPSERVMVHTDSTFSVHMIHDHNISPKKTDGAWWHAYPVEEIQKIMDDDWQFYANDGAPVATEFVPAARVVHKSAQAANITPVKNIYACLVHEQEDCVIDLVRNLHFHDPSSVILLYNGGNNPNLFSNRFPYGQFGAVMYPRPVPAKWGYLHHFALQSMEFALQNFNCDTLTIVDSDQLAIRKGYAGYLAANLQERDGLGMLSSRYEKVLPADVQVFPAVQAFKETDLWQPLLQQFENGDDKFVHWTFWPSTVFLRDAMHDLTQLFKKNTVLQDIMQRTKIWATEEVILPTLVKLLGYDIQTNPCSYDYVKYKRSFSVQETNRALSRTDAFWMHPVERRYDNAVRKHLRGYFRHYTPFGKPAVAKDQGAQELFITSAVLSRIKNIQGWLEPDEAELLMAIAIKVCREQQQSPNIVEVGCYQGKATVALGSVAKAFGGAAVYTIDPHDGRQGAADDCIYTLPASFELFAKNISEAGLSRVVHSIRTTTDELQWDKPVAFLYIDGLHDYPHVSADFWAFAACLVPGAYIGFHDYADYYPGVQAMVHELLHSGHYYKVHQAGTLVILQKTTLR